MNDGLRVPGRFDDMATFPGQNGRIILIRNHELALNQSEFGAFSGNHLPEEAAASRAERGANGQLLLARGAAREQPLAARGAQLLAPLRRLRPRSSY